ncbi:MAG: sulfatase-like hydrolase/transferase [Firmicutes bacterium]|nr:sulfatase-like hydrolase/transferase [Bacillota bacterium]
MRPNVLLIMHDQQRFDCIGAAHCFPVKTPNIDALASDGAWFDRAYTPIPVCAPARQSLFCGVRPEADGGLWNPHNVFPIRLPRLPEKPWVSSVRDSGYRTVLLGQWETEGPGPLDFGFDKYVSRGEINAPAREKFPDISYKNGYFGEPSQLPLEYSSTHLTAARAIAEIDEMSSGSKPWFLMIDNNEPHLPCRPSAPYDTMYDPDDIPEWGSMNETFEKKPYIQKQQLYNWELEEMSWDDWKHTVAYYYGIISQADDAIGRIVSHLKEKGLYENTIIVYTSDHGDLCGAHRLIDKHYNMYEDICRVPMTVTWKNRIPPMRVTGYSQHCLDLGPTILGLTGTDYDSAQYQGRDLSSGLLAGDSACGGDFAVSTYNGQQFGLYCERMIIKDGLKYVWNATDTDELYNLETDPNELDNIIADNSYSEKVTELRLLLHKELSRCGDPILYWCDKQLKSGRILINH